MHTWQRQCAQWDCLGDGGLLRTLGDPRSLVLVWRCVWCHLQKRLVRLWRGKAWTRLVLDIIAIAIAAVYGLYGCGGSEGCGGMVVRAPTYWIEKRCTIGALPWKDSDLLHGPANAAQSRLSVRISSHLEFRREGGRGLSLATTVRHKFL